MLSTGDILDGIILYIKLIFLLGYFLLLMAIVLTLRDNNDHEKYKSYSQTVGVITQADSNGGKNSNKRCTFYYVVQKIKWFGRLSCSWPDNEGREITVYYNKSSPGNDPALFIPETSNLTNWILAFSVYTVLVLIFTVQHVKRISLKETL